MTGGRRPRAVALAIASLALAGCGAATGDAAGPSSRATPALLRQLTPA